MDINTDPLGDVTIFWLQREGQKLCDCPAKNNSAMRHGSLCNWSREYAALCLEGTDPDMVKSAMLGARVKVNARGVVKYG